MPPYIREQLEAGIRVRRESGQSINEIATWLGSPDAIIYHPTVGEAADLLSTTLGLSAGDALNVLRGNESWAPLVGLLEGTDDAS